MVGKTKSQRGKETKRSRPKRDQCTVVLEDLRSQFNLFGESLDYVSNTLDKHTEKFMQIEKELLGIRLEVDFVKNELALIRHNQITRDEFRLLETRVARLERAKR